MAIELLTRLKQAADLHTPSLNQRIIAALIEDGTLDRQLPVVRAIYQRQRNALLAAMDRHLSRFATWEATKGGMFVWVTLRPDSGLEAKSLFESRPRSPGRLRSLRSLLLRGTRPVRTLRLAFSTLPAACMDEGMARLSAAGEDALARGVSS